MRKVFNEKSLTWENFSLERESFLSEFDTLSESETFPLQCETITSEWETFSSVCDEKMSDSCQNATLSSQDEKFSGQNSYEKF